jgi:hypothetical protein
MAYLNPLSIGKNACENTVAGYIKNSTAYLHDTYIFVNKNPRSLLNRDFGNTFNQPVQKLFAYNHLL